LRGSGVILSEAKDPCAAEDIRVILSEAKDPCAAEEKDRLGVEGSFVAALLRMTL
jgi:hypothetical protein